jgi:hypothetical protein
VHCDPQAVACYRISKRWSSVIEVDVKADRMTPAFL